MRQLKKVIYFFLRLLDCQKMLTFYMNSPFKTYPYNTYILFRFLVAISFGSLEILKNISHPDSGMISDHKMILSIKDGISSHHQTSKLYYFPNENLLHTFLFPLLLITLLLQHRRQKIWISFLFKSKEFFFTGTL